MKPKKYQIAVSITSFFWVFCTLLKFPLVSCVTASHLISFRGIHFKSCAFVYEMEENLFLQFYVLGAPLDFSFGLGKFGDILF